MVERAGSRVMPTPDHRSAIRAAAVALGMTLTASACAGGTDVGDGRSATAPTELGGGIGPDGSTEPGSAPLIAPAPGHPDGWPGVTNLPDPDDVYDPILAGENPPDGFRQSIPRDGIRPIYVPTFVTADEVGWPDEELVIGVDLAGEARAYPVGFLTQREIVNDMHRGIPTFVTW